MVTVDSEYNVQVYGMTFVSHYRRELGICGRRRRSRRRRPLAALSPPPPQPLLLDQRPDRPPRDAPELPRPQLLPAGRREQPSHVGLAAGALRDRPRVPGEPAVLRGRSADEAEALHLVQCQGLVHDAPGVDVGALGTLLGHGEDVVLKGDLLVAALAHQNVTLIGNRVSPQVLALITGGKAAGLQFTILRHKNSHYHHAPHFCQNGN